jgi:hypothetical protein
MYVRFKDNHQDKYPFWGNIILIEATSDEEALAKAIVRAKEDEGDSEDSFTWEGRPAIWSFAGIRKLIACEEPEAAPQHGTEVTYLELEVDTRDSFEKLLTGEPVMVKYS